MKIPKSPLIGLAAALLLATATPAVHAQAAAAAPAAPSATIEPAAKELIAKISDLYKDAKTFNGQMAIKMKIELPGLPPQDFAMNYDLAMERPNKYAMTLKEGAMGANSVSDGKNLYIHVPMVNKYMVQPAPTNLDTIGAGGATELLGPLDQMDFIGALFAENPAAAFLDGVKSGKLLPAETIDGVESDRLQFTQDDLSWDLWAAKGAKPTVQQLTADLSSVLGKMLDAQGGDVPPQVREMMKQAKMTMKVNFPKMEFNQAIAASTFEFKAPEGAQKVDSFMQAAADGQDEEEEEPAADLLDKPAPDFELALLDGGKMKLSQHKGKEIVILDFWATWCPPCVRAMPIIIEVANNFKSKGVVFYAMNQDEDVKTIKDYIAKKKWVMPITLDVDSKVGTLYGVEGIPTTVIVDKEGVVRNVHVGFSPSLKEDLTKKLEEILAAKKN